MVHGDFRLGNLMVDGDGLAAVLDWELAHLGDPMEDLGWFCVKAWRFGAEPPVAGLGRYEDLFDAYDAAGGPARRPGRGALVGGARHAQVGRDLHPAGVDPPHRLSRSVELAAIGRRVCENEYDLLELLP